MYLVKNEVSKYGVARRIRKYYLPGNTLVHSILCFD